MEFIKQQKKRISNRSSSFALGLFCLFLFVLLGGWLWGVVGVISLLWFVLRTAEDEAEK